MKRTDLRQELAGLTERERVILLLLAGAKQLEKDELCRFIEALEELE